MDDGGGSGGGGGGKGRGKREDEERADEEEEGGLDRLRVGRWGGLHWIPAALGLEGAGCAGSGGPLGPC